MEKVGKKLQITVTLLLFLLSNFVEIDLVSTETSCKSRIQNETTNLIVDDFSNFTIREDHNEIVSENTNHSITFEHPFSGNAGADEYVFHFDRSCTDFKIRIAVNYNLYSWSGYCSIFLSSYKNEEGEFVDDIQGVSLCYGLIEFGELNSGSYPFDIKDEIGYGFYDNGHSTAEFIFERTENTLSCEVICNSTFVLLAQWDSGVTKHLDMIKIKAYVSGNPATMDIDFFNFNANLSLLDKTDFLPNTSNSDQTLVLPLDSFLPFGITFLVIVIIRKVK